MQNSTITLHRVIKSTPLKVYRAFTEPLAMTAWLPPYGYLCEVHSMDVQVGGSYKMSFVNFSTGHAHSFGGKYLELIPHSLIRYSDQFDDPNLPGEMITTIKLTVVSCGTEIHIEQTNVPAIIPAELCYLGWQDSLDKLMKLVEPDIPDAV